MPAIIHHHSSKHNIDSIISTNITCMGNNKSSWTRFGERRVGNTVWPRSFAWKGNNVRGADAEQGWLPHYKASCAYSCRLALCNTSPTCQKQLSFPLSMLLSFSLPHALITCIISKKFPVTTWITCFIPCGSHKRNGGHGRKVPVMIHIESITGC